jgi:threonine dehydrogenase-like Zn-dependent dehydrogenase
VKALAFHFSYPRLAAAKIAGAFVDGGTLTSLGPMRYADVPDAQLLGDDWVVVATRYCGICGSDVKQAWLEGAFDNPLRAVVSFPHVLGHEIVGTVAEVGKDVRSVKKGDRVACFPWITCRVRGLPECEACVAGALSQCRNFTAGRFAPGMHHGTCRDLSGGFATHMPAHESACFVIPEDVTFEEAALADPFAVCLHALGKAPPKDGETVVVFGCGALGMMLIHLLARLHPGVRVWGVDVHASLRDKALAAGAADLLALGGGDLVAEIGERTKAKLMQPGGGMPWLQGGVDRIYDTVASARTLETGVRMLRSQGSLVMVGVASPARFEWTPMYFKELVVIGASGYGMETVAGQRAHAFRHYLDWVATKRLEPAAFVTHKFSMRDFREGFVTARQKGRTGSIKVLLEP